MGNPIQETLKLGQAIWLDDIRRGMLKSGELKRLIDLGVSGLTANPTILEKAIVESNDYNDALPPLIRANRSAEEIYTILATEDVCAAADLLLPLYNRTGGIHGFVSLEINPLLAYDTEATIEESKRLFATLNRPNAIVKVPATPQGIPAIRRLLSQGINVNVTLIFSLNMYRQVMEAYIGGLEDRVKAGEQINKVASVASFFLSRIDTAVDARLQERIKQGETQLMSLLGKAAIASSKLAYKLFRETFYGERFVALKKKGARVQRPLWASTGTKNPAYSDVMYVEPLIGPDTVNTLPLPTINAFLEHGHVEATVEQNLSEAEKNFADLASARISMESVTAKLLADGVKAFSDSYQKLLASIEEKRGRLLH